MAPRKKKDEKESPDSGSALILEYLEKQNRPYSALDISTNLHGKVTKAFAAKALKEMHERKEIEGRAAGKQIVYHAIQQIESDDLTATNGIDPDQTNKDLQETILSLKTRERELREKLTAMNAVVPLTTLRDQIGSLEERKSSLASQISELTTAELSEKNSNSHVSKEDIDRIDLEWQRLKYQVTARKRVFLEFWARCTEVLPPDTTEPELKEILGVEGLF